MDDLRGLREEWIATAREQGEALKKAQDLLHTEVEKDREVRDWSVVVAALKLLDGVSDALYEMEVSS